MLSNGVIQLLTECWRGAQNFSIVRRWLLHRPRAATREPAHRDKCQAISLLGHSFQGVKRSGVDRCPVDSQLCIARLKALVGLTDAVQDAPVL